VTQELAYLARNLDLLAASASAETVERLRRAVERAQAESRRAIHALTAPAAGRAVETMLAEAVSKIAERFNVELAFDSVSGVRLSEPRAEALVRIACEALTNAARHSGTSLVRLTLTRDGQRVRLRVSDAGRGFNPDATGGGFGLIAIRERARSVGGELRIRSAPGAGSEVEAVL
jgi:signal transduction histidine kinase